MVHFFRNPERMLRTVLDCVPGQEQLRQRNSGSHLPRDERDLSWSEWPTNTAKLQPNGWKSVLGRGRKVQNGENPIRTPLVDVSGRWRKRLERA